jgi:phospholipid/cholesterol/gamma-HCH transport system ATP-binding protein
MIRIEHLTKQFGSKKVLDDISFEVKDKETVVIIGSSGTGKSVLLKNIIGLIAPTSGSIFIDDVDITKCSKDQLRQSRRKMGYVFQEAALFDSLSVAENVAFGLQNLSTYTPKQINDRVMECLSMVGLKDINLSLKPSEISGGMKKRVGIARAIAYGPKVLFYDEPTTGLDPIMTDVISDLIIDLRQKSQVTSIVVTHDMHSAFKIADRIIMLYKGKIVYTGTAEETKRTDNAYARQFVDGLGAGPIETERIFR